MTTAVSTSEHITQLLAQLEVAEPDSGAGYDRDVLFGDQWLPVGECDTRAVVLARDLTHPQFSARTPCRVTGGDLLDPYTDTLLSYQPGTGTIEIDHVVSLFNAWTTGAQDWDAATRIAFANDTANLLAVSAAANQDKGGSDAEEWTPTSAAFGCSYAAIQISIKHTYDLWVTPTEKQALTDLLQQCQ